VKRSASPLPTRPPPKGQQQNNTKSDLKTLSRSHVTQGLVQLSAARTTSTGATAGNTNAVPTAMALLGNPALSHADDRMAEHRNQRAVLEQKDDCCFAASVVAMMPASAPLLHLLMMGEGRMAEVFSTIALQAEHDPRAVAQSAVGLVRELVALATSTAEDADALEWECRDGKYPEVETLRRACGVADKEGVGKKQQCSTALIEALMSAIADADTTNAFRQLTSIGYDVQYTFNGMEVATLLTARANTVPVDNPVVKDLLNAAANTYAANPTTYRQMSVLAGTKDIMLRLPLPSTSKTLVKLMCDEANTVNDSFSFTPNELSPARDAGAGELATLRRADAKSITAQAKITSLGALFFIAISRRTKDGKDAVQTAVDVPDELDFGSEPLAGLLAPDAKFLAGTKKYALVGMMLFGGSSGAGHYSVLVKQYDGSGWLGKDAGKLRNLKAPNATHDKKWTLLLFSAIPTGPTVSPSVSKNTDSASRSGSTSGGGGGGGAGGNNNGGGGASGSSSASSMEQEPTASTSTAGDGEDAAVGAPPTTTAPTPAAATVNNDETAHQRDAAQDEQLMRDLAEELARVNAENQRLRDEQQRLGPVADLHRQTMHELREAKAHSREMEAKLEEVRRIQEAAHRDDELRQRQQDEQHAAELARARAQADAASQLKMSETEALLQQARAREAVATDRASAAAEALRTETAKTTQLEKQCREAISALDRKTKDLREAMGRIKSESDKVTELSNTNQELTQRMQKEIEDSEKHREELQTTLRVLGAERKKRERAEKQSKVSAEEQGRLADALRALEKKHDDAARRLHEVQLHDVDTQRKFEIASTQLKALSDEQERLRQETQAAREEAVGKAESRARADALQQQLDAAVERTRAAERAAADMKAEIEKNLGVEQHLREECAKLRTATAEARREADSKAEMDGKLRALQAEIDEHRSGRDAQSQQLLTWSSNLMTRERRLRQQEQENATQSVTLAVGLEKLATDKRLAEIHLGQEREHLAAQRSIMDQQRTTTAQTCALMYQNVAAEAQAARLRVNATANEILLTAGAVLRDNTALRDLVQGLAQFFHSNKNKRQQRRARVSQDPRVEIVDDEVPVEETRVTAHMHEAQTLANECETLWKLHGLPAPEERFGEVYKMCSDKITTVVDNVATCAAAVAQVVSASAIEEQNEEDLADIVQLGDQVARALEWCHGEAASRFVDEGVLKKLPTAATIEQMTSAVRHSLDTVRELSQARAASQAQDYGMQIGDAGSSRGRSVASPVPIRPETGFPIALRCN